MGYSRKTSFCRGMPSDAWTDNGSNMREKRIMMKVFLDMISTSFYLTGFTGYLFLWHGFHRLHCFLLYVMGDVGTFVTLLGNRFTHSWGRTSAND